MKRYALLLIGLAIIVVTTASYFAFPKWRNIDGGFLSLVSVAIVGVLGVTANIVSIGKDLGLWGKEGAKDVIEPQTRIIILNHVENFWIKGILEKSLHGVALMKLGIKENPQAVNYPWDVHRETNNELLPPDKSMLDIFHEIGMGRSLLILGEPGSGKTTMLLELGRQLIEQARKRKHAPMPIIFNLSSWSQKKSINDWLVEQLVNFYRVDKKIAQALINGNHYLLLLDELDEVRREDQETCIKTINDFRKKRGIIQIVVCSRSQEYAEFGTQLEFDGAVTIQPLNPDHINTYLDRFGNRLAGIRVLLKQDKILKELAKTPLMLSIMTVAFKDTSSKHIQLSRSITVQRKHIFDTYINRMFERPGHTERNPFSKKDALHWLSWLAKKMTQNNQTIFFVEELQPDWLGNEKQKKTYYKVYRWFFTLIFMMLGGMVFGVSFWLMDGLFDVVIGGILFGIVIGGLYGTFMFFIATTESKENKKQILPVGSKQILPISTLYWSWKKSLIGFVRYFLLYGFAGGVIGLVSDGVRSGLLIALLSGVSGGASFGMMSGLGFSQIKDTTFPNQNIILSLKNSLRMSLLLGIGTGVGIGLTKDINRGLLFGAISAGLSWLAFGGDAVLKHYILRYFLNDKNYITWKIVPFLDYATDQIVLRKIGGGYIFIHRSLMEHISELEI